MIDGHCHLDNTPWDCAKAMHSLYNTACSIGIRNIVLLNLPELAFDNNQVINNAKGYKGFYYVFPSVNPVIDSSIGEIIALKAAGATGLKLHPRLHGYHIGNDMCIELLHTAGELEMPVIVDCFQDGKSLALGNTLEAFARVAEMVPECRIAIGHAGGHRILDALMVAKYYKNMFLDLSYTLLFFRNSSIIKDIAFTIKSIHGERIFWGSDYPDRPYAETFNLSMQEFNKMNLSESTQKALTEVNIRGFLRGG